MNKNDLCLKLNDLFTQENELIGEFYFVLKSDQQKKVKFADIDFKDQKELTYQFIATLKTNITENEDLYIMELSRADDRANVIYEYDINSIPDDLLILNEVKTNKNLDTFNYKNDSFFNINGIILLLSNGTNTLTIYQHIYPVSCLKKDSSFNLVKFGHNERLVKLESDILKISTKYDFFDLNGTLFINNIKTLEKYFKFHDVILNHARDSINVIKKAGLVENPDELEVMLSNTTFARKLVKAAKMSPVLGKIPNKEIIQFIINYPSLKGKLELNDTQDKICLKTKKSKELLIKVLNDDYLYSQLTQFYYSSIAKDAIEEYQVG